jgi:hypothetical protein
MSAPRVRFYVMISFYDVLGKYNVCFMIVRSNKRLNRRNIDTIIRVKKFAKVI